jgi:hypothetical protein
MYKGLLELIKLIFGPKALSKTIGTRTNVIQLPNNKTKRYIKSDLDIESASDAAAMNAKKEMEELVAEIPKMNDAERLIFEGNLRRLKNRLGIRSETDPTADVFQFGTKEKVTPGGIASLTEKAGQKSPPGTLMGNIESRIKQLEASGEDLSKMKGQTLDEIMGDVMQTQKTMSKMQDEGLVRAAVRYKMMDDLKRGTLKLPKNLEDVVRGASNEEDVITVFRNNYGEDALEQVDSLIPDFYNMTSPADAVKKIEKNFPNMKPKKIEVKQTMDLDEATKAEQENILTPGKAIPADSPEGKKITEALIGKPKAEVVSLPTAEKILSDMRNLGPIDAMKEANKVLKREGPYKNLTDKDIEKIMDDINDHIFGGDLPVDPEDFATGGRVGFMDGGSKGLDYLTGIERQGYANGDYVVQAGIKNYLGKQKTATVPIKWKSGKDHPDTELAYITKPEKELLIKLDLHGSMKDGKPNKGPGGIISLNSGGSGNGGSGGGGGNGGGSDASGNDTSPGATGGAGGDPGDPGSEASGGGGSTDTGDMGSEAANVSSTQSGAASVGVGGIGGFGDPGVTVGSMMGNFGRNVANMARANPISSMIASAVLGPIGSLAFNAARAYGPTGTTSTTSTTESDGDGGDGRTPISSFDISLLTPDLLDSYNLAKNRDYRLYQGANNPFYSMQAVPSGGIKNVYTEFKKGGRVRMAGGGVSQGLDYLTGIERRGYQEGTQTTPTEDFSDYLNKDTSSNILKDLYLKDIGITGKDDEPRLNILQKYLDFNKNIKNNTPLNEYVKGARSGLYSDYVDPYAEGFNLEKDYFKSPNNLRRLAIDYDPRSGKLAYYDKNEGPYGAYKYYSGDLVDQDFVDSFGLKRFDPKDEFGFSGFSTQAYGPTEDFSDPSFNTDSQGRLVSNLTGKPPTEDFSDYLNTTTINTNAQTTPAVEEQMISPEDALTPSAPDVNPLQQHFDQNQMLKDAVARGEITPEQYNQLGGYDVQQTLSPGNPVLGGIGNLIGSTGYNIVQSLKDGQSFGDAAGDVMRNVQGGLGLISPELKQTYQDIVKQKLPYMDQYQKDYQTRISQVDPNALRNRYLENLQNTSSQDINQYQSQLRSNLVPRENQPQGLDYLTGL